MLNVSNKKVINKLANRDFRGKYSRNAIAIFAIILTTILFTSVFTIAISLNYTIEQQNMRLVGGMSHGSFKYLSKEQVEELRKHSLIKESGASIILATPNQVPFNKIQAEMRYGENSEAKMYFSYPTVGRMPKEELEIATDTRILDALGIPHRIGEKVTITYPMINREVTQTFILTGYWETDEVSLASQIWLSKDYVLEQLNKCPDISEFDPSIGTWSLDILFHNTKDIGNKIAQIAFDSGYTIEDETADNYLSVGVNWAYSQAKADNSDNKLVYVSMALAMLLIIASGYLIIYNIFQISIASDIKFYGLLKTIGTTGKQIKRIVRRQILLLCAIGIPIGLLLGFLIGNGLMKTIVGILSVSKAYVTYNPLIFIGAAVFSLMTVWISCRKPQKMAVKVSPVEALRFTDTSIRSKKISRKNTHGINLFKMALANLTRNKKKSILVIVSLTLSVLLLNTTFSLSMGFDSDKFLESSVVSDFLMGNANYFKSKFYSKEDGVSEQLIDAFEKTVNIKESGSVYKNTEVALIHFTKEQFLDFYGNTYGDVREEELDSYTSIYGLDNFTRTFLRIIDGKLDLEKLEKGIGIVQIVDEDDYGNPFLEKAIYAIGDKVSIDFIDNYYMDENGDVVKEGVQTKEFEVIATAVMPFKMTSRSSGLPCFAFSIHTLQNVLKDGGTRMNYLANVETKEDIKNAESFLEEYTTKVESEMDFESKETYMREFAGFKNMFLIVGGCLSAVVGIIGILNYINAIVTSIIARKRELAMLNSIGMTNKQTKKMLIMEGILYAGISIVLSFVITLVGGRLILKPVESIFWFYTYQFTILPILIVLPLFVLLGILIPLMANKMANKQSIVERLRNIEE